MPPVPTIQIRMVIGDVLSYGADVLVLKHAQGLYGADRAVYERLASVRPAIQLPDPGQRLLVDTQDKLRAAFVLFIGVEPLLDFGYEQIREFGRRAILALAEENLNFKRITVTVHGPGYGLDETEAFKSELAGIVEAITAGDFPGTLESVTFVERDVGRSRRLTGVLSELIPNGCLEIAGRGPMGPLDRAAQHSLRTAGYASASKPRVFIAMSFAPEMDDVFHYGLQGAVNAAGLLAERADLTSFTGDVMNWVKTRISTATLVIADVSSSNPNVYLEVGYAWGRNVPTVLVARSALDLKFDVQGQRCIFYSSIKELEEKLTRELKGLYPIAVP